MKLALLTLLALSLNVSPLFAAAVAKAHCPVCGMDFERDSPTSYHAKQGEKDHHFCSFSCSLKFHRKFSDVPLEARDFFSKKTIAAGSAFFIAHSKAIVSELPFDMPPSVIAFEKKADAEKKMKQLKDGTLVEGYSRLEKIYE